MAARGEPTAFVFGVTVGLRPTAIVVALVLICRWQVERYIARLTLFYSAKDPILGGGYTGNLTALDVVRPLFSTGWTLLVVVAFVAIQVTGARLAGQAIAAWEAQAYTAGSALIQGAVAATLAAGGLVAAMAVGVAGIDGSGDPVFTDGYIGGYWFLFGAVYVPIGLASSWVVVYSAYRLITVAIASPRLVVPTGSTFAG